MVIATVLLLAVFIAGLHSCSIYYDAKKIDYPVAKTPQQVTAGRHLAILMCSPCHYDTATKQLTGIHMADFPSFIGKVYSRNITNDPEKGIATYSDGELAYLLRTGIARDGRLMPYMEKPLLSDEDLRSLIAFLRSDDPLVKPSKVEPPATKYTALGKVGLKKVSPPLKYPKTEIAPHGTTPAVWGQYLVYNLNCFDCHSATMTKINRTEPEKSKGYMGGGNTISMGKEKITTPNLTFDSTGIARWSKDDFIRTLKTGVSPSRGKLRPPMPHYGELSSDESGAIYEYLKTLPHIRKEVKK